MKSEGEFDIDVAYWSGEYADAVAVVLCRAKEEGVLSARAALKSLEALKIRIYTSGLMSQIQSVRALVQEVTEVVPDTNGPLG